MEHRMTCSSESNTLLHVRSLISGCQQGFGISTEARLVASFCSTDYRNLVIMATMGLAVICNSLKEASVVFNGNSSKTAARAMAFIQGTGLEVTIQTFELDLNANQIRAEFYRIFHAK